MTRLLTALLFIALSGTSSAQAQSRARGAHPCAADAIAKATPLLTLHFGDGDKVQNLSVDQDVRVLPPIKALVGTGRLDVLELRGYIYKAEYRMRFIYAQPRLAPGTCALMGQEILEISNPY